MKVAIVKPDHVGDFVLSKPAIGALIRHFGDITLFVGTPVFPLANAIFPGLNVRPMDLPHLSKSGTIAVTVDEARCQLLDFDLIVFLRDDKVIRQLASTLKARLVYSGGDHLTHETLIQKRALCNLIQYSRTELFSGEPIEWPRTVSTVGLCIGAGFPNNRWPHVYWIEIAQELAAGGVDIRIVGGQAERLDAELIRKYLGLPEEHVILGSSDFRAFWSAIDDVDVVLATDGGTAHLCSLRRPVLSIFASSPWRRYAPFGKYNRLLTRDLACCPCVQFSSDEVNACVTRECASWILPRDVLRVICTPCLSNMAQEIGRCVLWSGVSHLARN